MAEIIDFKVEKKRILKKWEAEIEVDIKAQDWYIEAKRKLDFKLGYIKMLIVLDVVPVWIFAAGGRYHFNMIAGVPAEPPSMRPYVIIATVATRFVRPLVKNSTRCKEAFLLRIPRKIARLDHREACFTSWQLNSSMTVALCTAPHLTIT